MSTDEQFWRLVTPKQRIQSRHQHCRRLTSGVELATIALMEEWQTGFSI
jgi:hypothetical protein